MYLRNDGICVFTNRIHSNADITVGTMGSFFGLYVRSTASTAGQSNTVNLAQNTELGWTSGTDASAAPDSGFSRLGAAAVALGNGTAADKTGTLSLAGVKFVEGSNARMGTATLTAGAATVSNTSVTANSRIFLTSQADGGTPGWLRVSARTASTSFTITSSSGTDTSTVAWIIYEPA